MYTQPYSWLLTTFATNAIANTATVQAVLGAPGAGLAYRIIGYRGWWRRDSTGVLDATLAGTGGTSNIGGFALANTGNRSEESWFPFPGLLTVVNSSITLTDNCTVANQAYRFIIYYFTDAV